VTRKETTFARTIAETRDNAEVLSQRLFCIYQFWWLLS